MKNDCNCQPSCCCPSNEEIFYTFKNGAELHNRELIYVTSLANFMQFNFTKAFNASTDFCTSAYPTINVSSIITFNDANVFFEKIKELTATEKQAEFADFLYGMGLINTKQREFLKLIVNTILSLQDKDPVLITSAVLGIQNTLFTRTDLSESDRSAMYAMSAISVSATEFWAAALRDANNKWHAAAIGSNLPNWIKKGLADLLGFTAGAIVGTLIGGPAVGAAGGTLVGGACSNAI
jgi:hypothetical protein